MKNFLLLLFAVLLITLFSTCSFLYPLNPWDDANVYMTIGNAMLGGRELYVDIFDHKGPVSRTESAKILLDKARELHDGLPVFFTGDLNTGPRSEAIAILSDNELVKDSYTSSETAPTGRKSPYYGFDFDRQDTDRGDFIFVPKDATVHSYACIDDDIKDRQYSSDHCPVLVVVTIN